MKERRLMGQRKGAGVWLAMLCILLAAGGVIRAQEPETTEDRIAINALITATADMDARSGPDEGADVVFQVSQGQSLLAVGEDGDWYRIFYQGQYAYIPKVSAQAQEMNLEALEEEMSREAEEGEAFIESLEMHRSAAKRTRIWGAVIILLILAILVVGVVSAIKKRKQPEEGSQKGDSTAKRIR